MAEQKRKSQAEKAAMAAKTKKKTPSKTKNTTTKRLYLLYLSMNF